MNILVLRLSSMGDVILATPLLSYLRERKKDAAVTFVTASAYAPLFDGDPRLLRVVAFDKKRPSLDPVLAKTEWDHVLDLQNTPLSRGFVASLPHVRTVARFDKLHLKRIFLLLLRVNRYVGSPNVATRYIECAGGGVSVDDTPPVRFYFSNEEQDRLLARFLERTGGGMRPSLALFPFSAWRNKQWPEKRFAEVGRHFLSKGWHVAIFGGPDERERAEALKEQIGPSCSTLAGRLSLRECGALLSSFSLALGNDTGLIHLARAVGVKTGILYGPTTWHFGFYPYGPPAYRLFETPLFCRPCHAHGGNFCFRGSRPCLGAISSAEVISGLESLSAV